MLFNDGDGEEWKNPSVAVPVAEPNPLDPHEPTAVERTRQIDARRAGIKLWAQICDLLRKKVL